METKKHDPVTGRMTTGHEWNGIEELDTPIPRVVLAFLAATALFSLIYWILMPAWPLGVSYTKGLLGFDQREVVTRQVREAAAAREVWTRRIEVADLADINADPELMRHVVDTGRTLFIDNCAACHGVNGSGSPGFPNLTAGSWIWGGELRTLAETIRVGINATHPNTRVSQMMAFGRDGILDRNAVLSVTAYVRSLSNQRLAEEDRTRLKTGREVYAANCATCHGADGTGKREFGAPDLTDDRWLYGGDAHSIFTSIHAGRQGHMPHWEGRLSPTEIQLLALYVGTLSMRRQ